MIYIVIVNYNCHVDLIECLESLSRSTFTDFRIVIVDNGSEPGSIEYVKTWFDKALDPVGFNPAIWQRLPTERRVNLQLYVHDRHTKWTSSEAGTVDVVLAGANLGFAAANNIGLDYAFQDPDCAHVLLLNPDTVVTPGFLEPMLDRMTDSGVGMCGSTLLYYDESDTIQTCGAHFNPWTQRTLLLGEGRPFSERPAQDVVEQRLSYIAGASMMVSRRFYQAIGPMYEGYFLYFEEMDWARRGQGQFTMAWAPDSVIYHKEGGSIGSSQRSRPSNTSIYYLSINLLRFHSRLDRAFLPLAATRLALLAGRYLVRRDPDGARTIFCAFRDFAFGWRRTGRIDLAEMHHP